MWRLLVGGALFLGATFSIVGCGGRAEDMPEIGAVHGIVTLDDQPVVGVTVYFTPDEGRLSIAKTDENGEYEAMYLIDEEGVKVGPCVVSVEWAPDDSGPAIPARYGTESELHLDVKPGDNEFDIRMTSG